MDAETIQSSKAADANKWTYTPMQKRLRWAIQGGDGKTGQQWTITPATAAEMLTWNTGNRPVRAGRLKQYVAQMKAGQFPYTAEPIIFSHTRLLNGQHRLKAIVESGVELPMMVVFGAPDEAFAYMDTGQPRGVADVMAIEGVPNAKAMGAITTFVMKFNVGKASDAAFSSRSATNQEVYEYFSAHPAIADSFTIYSKFKNRRFKRPTIMAGLHYLCARKNKAMADAFFTAVAEGIGFSGKNDPAYRLSQFLAATSVIEGAMRVNLVFATIQAWNAARGSRANPRLRMVAGDTIPAII